MSWTIYFWEPCLSPHKLALFRALQAMPEIDGCIYIAQEGLPAERALEGWQVGATDDLDIRIAPDGAQIAQIFEQAPRNAVHLFSGTHWVPCIVNGLKHAAKCGATFGLMTEPRVREGWKGVARLLHSWLTERHVRRHASFVLAIGRNGPIWFRRAGYRRDRIFPFAYFLPLPHRVLAGERGAQPVIGYLGRLTRPKGVQLFLQAAEAFPDDARIVIAGRGDREADVRAAETRLTPRLHFGGAIPMDSVSRFLNEIDVLVVPSLTTDDGWAAVVSEGLMAGCAVVATDRVGASICLDDQTRGRVVSRLAPSAISAAVNDIVRDLAASRAARETRAHWGRAHLSGVAGARYLVNILQHLLAGAPQPAPFYADEGVSA